MCPLNISAGPGGLEASHFTFSPPQHHNTCATMGQTMSRVLGRKRDNKKILLTDNESPEREVKKANRELNTLTSRMTDMQKIEVLQKRVTEHLADMKRLERENLKNKKRGDILQKEKDLARTDQNKTNTLKDKLEKLCRELQRENNRLKVCHHGVYLGGFQNADWLGIE